MAPTELDTQAAVDFLKALDLDGWHNITAIAPGKNPVARTFAPGQFDAMFDFIDAHNGSANLYFSVNEPRPNAPHDKLSAADIAAARAVHVDLDPPAGADLAADRIESIRRVSSAPVQPTFLVDSGGGIQAFWKLAEKVPLETSDWLRNLNEAACAAFAGDPSVKNVDRIMRLPHTLNIPTSTKLKKHPGRKARMAEVLDVKGPLHAPEELRAAFPARGTDRVKKSEIPLVELDQPSHISRAKHYLVHNAPEAIEGDGGDNTTFRVAAKLRSLGLSESMALEMMLDHWNEQKASPPWQPEDLATTVGNAFTYANGGWGSETAQAEFEPLDIDVGERPPPQSEHTLDIEEGERPPEKKNTIKVLRGSDFAGLDVPKREWHSVDLIPAKTVTMLNGDGGTGKSLIALQLAVATILGRPWFGKMTAQGNCTFLSAEDDTDELHRRLVDVAAKEGVDLRDLRKLSLIPLAGKDALLAAPQPGTNILQKTPLYDALCAHIDRAKTKLLVLDTLADLFGGEENQRAQARQFIGLLRHIAIDKGCTVLLLAHPSLSGMASGSGSSGSTAWNNSVRSRLYFERVKNSDGGEDDPDLRVLRTVKANYGRTGDQIDLRWDRGVFICADDADGQAVQAAKQAKAERVFMGLLSTYNACDRFVSMAQSSIYAPAVFAKDHRSEGLSRDALAQAMNRLHERGRIETRDVTRNYRKRQYLYLVQDEDDGFESPADFE